MTINPYADPQGPVIARLKEHTETTGGGLAAILMMVLVAIVMVMAFITDTSAIRGAAYGAVGTALIVFFGIGAVLGRRRTYIVYREPPPT